MSLLNNSLEKWFNKVESAQDFLCKKFDKQKKIVKICQENKDLQKRKQST